MTALATSHATLPGGSIEPRIRQLARLALEDSLPMSELFAEALASLRQAAEETERLRAELERVRRQPDNALLLHQSNGQLPAGREESRQSESQDGDGRSSLADGEREETDFDIFRGLSVEDPAALEDSIRERITGSIYLGIHRNGDRLPTIRELSRRTQLNHKVIRRVYGALARGGFVEIRDRSGVYLGDFAPGADPGLGNTEAWLSELLSDALQRGLNLGDLTPLLERAACVRSLSCACVDSCEDDRFALCEEINARFGMRTFGIVPGQGLSAETAAADIVVTTPFHAAEVRERLAPGKPLAVASIHPQWRRSVNDHAAPEPMPFFCVDPGAGNRFRQTFGPDSSHRIDIRPLTDSGSGPMTTSPCRGLITAAASSRLGTDSPSRDLLRPPYLSQSSVERITRALVQVLSEMDSRLEIAS
jgi:DNA-binding transcriptional regulator YhcF (GntR family)